MDNPGFLVGLFSEISNNFDCESPTLGSVPADNDEDEEDPAKFDFSERELSAVTLTCGLSETLILACEAPFAVLSALVGDCWVGGVNFVTASFTLPVLSDSDGSKSLEFLELTEDSVVIPRDCDSDFFAGEIVVVLNV